MGKDSIVLYGKNSVFERIKSDPQSIRKIYLQDNFSLGNIVRLIKRKNIATQRLSSRELSRIKPTKDLQGIVARAEPFTYANFNELLYSKDEIRPSLIFLDRINDPQNLGVIIRIAACFGNFAVVIPKYESCEVNETVVHVASGGENYVKISMVSNLANAIIKAKKTGYWIVGADISNEAENLHRLSLPFPLGILLGSEGGGIRQGLKNHIDIKARIPMEGARLSFNVSMACAVFCNEISRQRAVLNKI